MDAPIISFDNSLFEDKFSKELNLLYRSNEIVVAYSEKLSMIMKAIYNVDMLMDMDLYNLKIVIEINDCIRLASTSDAAMDLAIKTTIKYIDKCWRKREKELNLQVGLSTYTFNTRRKRINSMPLKPFG